MADKTSKIDATVKSRENETVCFSGERKTETETSYTKEKSEKRIERISVKRKQLGKGSLDEKYGQKHTEPIEKESKKRKSIDNENCIEKTSKLYDEDIRDKQQNVNEIELESEKRTECVLNDPKNPPERDGVESEGGVLDIVVKEETIEEVSRSNLCAPLKYIY